MRPSPIQEDHGYSDDEQGEPWRPGVAAGGRVRQLCTHEAHRNPVNHTWQQCMLNPDSSQFVQSKLDTWNKYKEKQRARQHSAPPPGGRSAPAAALAASSVPPPDYGNYSSTHLPGDYETVGMVLENGNCYQLLDTGRPPAAGDDVPDARSCGGRRRMAQLSVSRCTCAPRAFLCTGWP